MTKSTTYLIFSLLLLFYPTLGQEKKTSVSFNYFTHDFGTIKEEGGIVDYEFEFSNIGNAQLFIKNVQAACGCTVPEWPKEGIGPGSKGKIKVEFNPANKPGPFNKSLTVFTNAVNESVILNVTGKVIPKPRKPADDYPDLIGSFRMVSRYMNMGDISTEKTVNKSFTLYNQSDTTVTLQPIHHNYSFLKISIEPAVMLPKSKGKISIEYDPAKKNDFGYVQDKIELTTTDLVQPTKSIYVTGTIAKYFPAYTELDLRTQPKLKLDNMSYDFGLIKQGDKVTTAFNIANSGAGQLIIYKVKPSCGCTVTNLDKKTLASGEVGKLTITFDSQGKEGVQDKHINLYTNDPTNANPVITLKAKIQKN